MTRRATTTELRAQLLREANAVIEYDLAAEVRLGAVAQQLATSRRQLQRCFREVGKTTFSGHVTALRMQRAARLLERSPRPRVKEVARAVGYRQPAHFTKAFRTFHGVNPGEYVRSHNSPN